MEIFLGKKFPHFLYTAAVADTWHQMIKNKTLLFDVHYIHYNYKVAQSKQLTKSLKY
jgi:hypothetical protein